MVLTVLNPRTYLYILEINLLQRFSKLGIWQRNWEHPGNLTLKASGIWLQNFHRTRETDSRRTQIKPSALQDPEERSSDATRDWATCVWVSRTSGRGVVQQWPSTGVGALNTTILGAVACWHKSVWSRLPFTTITNTIIWSQAKVQGGNTAPPINRKLLWRFTEHNPAHQSKTQINHRESLSSRSFHKPLIPINQRTDRMKITVIET